MSLLITAHSYGGQGYITAGVVWMREHEQQGRVWFVVAYTMCLLLLLPASVLALLAGMPLMNPELFETAMFCLYCLNSLESTSQSVDKHWF